MDLEVVDSSRRTPFRLAVAMGRIACARLLLEFGSISNGLDIEGWSAVHDATGTGDAALLRLALEERNKAQRAEAQTRIPQLLHLLQTDEDFYVEMSWDFTSWVPFVSRVCPSDVYRIWKRGGCVRVDTTLLGYSNLQWKRGRRSYIFRCKSDGADGAGKVAVEMVLVDHDSRVAYVEDVLHMDGEQPAPVDDEEIEDRLNAPVAVTSMDADAIGFTRAKSGLWGFQSDRAEAVGEYAAKVFAVSGIEVVTKTRIEHLPPGHSSRRPTTNPLAAVASDSSESEPQTIAPCVDVDAYLQPRAGRTAGVVGRPREVRVQRQQFKATLWMAETFPLSLQRQVLPVVDLMAPTSQHIAKLRDFISLQLPAGFPVKIEIPVYRLVQARVTFGAYTRTVAADAFDVPAGYRAPGAGRQDGGAGHAEYNMAYEADMDDEQLLQHVMALSLLDAGGPAGGAAGGAGAAGAGTMLPGAGMAAGPWPCAVCTYENTRGTACEMCGTPRPAAPLPGPGRPDGGLEDPRLQQAIALSLGAAPRTAGDDNDELERVLALSLLDK